MSSENENNTLWEDFLNPESLRPTIIIISLYIAAFELLKTAIVDRIKDFYPIHSEYQSEVLSKNRSPVYASLEWLKDSDVITDADKDTFEKAKILRNKIAHEFTSILLHGLPVGFAEQFRDMITLLDKTERWWIVNVDIATNPDFDGQEIDESQVGSGRTMVLQMLLDIALGPEEESKKYMEEFIKITRRAAP